MLQNQRDFSVRCYFYTVLSFTMAIAAGTLRHLGISSTPAWLLKSLTLVAGLIFLAALVIAYQTAISVRVLVKKAAALDEYEADIRAKWGSDAI
jgi:uncharacterized membrane protein YeiH